MDKKIKLGREQYLAAAGLLFAAFIWGSSFVIMKQSLDQIPVLYLLAIRFTIASFVMSVVFFKRLKNIKKTDVCCGIVLGVFLFLSYLFQTYGLQYTTASKNAFITTLYVIFVPFFHWIFNHTKPEKRHGLAALTAIIGLALLSLDGELTINYGDFLTLISGICFALHIVFISRYCQTHDPIQLTVLQLIVVGIISWIAAPVFEGVFYFSKLGMDSWIHLCYLGIFCTMVGFLLQNVGQKLLPPNTSSILLSFESVFGLVFSIIFLRDPFTLKLGTGCLLLFLSVIIAEYTRKQIINR